MARYVLVACEVFKQDFDLLVPACKNQIDRVYMDLGLHTAGHAPMIKTLQEALDGIDQTQYEAILLGYGLCNNGITTLHASIPIVVARAHDCITLFMGSKQRYRDYFDTHKGTWYVTAGSMGTKLTDEITDDAARKAALRAKYREQYDEDTAEYLLETLGDPLKEYSRITFVNNGIGAIEEQRNHSREIAKRKNWEFDEFMGNTDILRGLLAGNWDPAVFLVVGPGERITQTYTEVEIVTGLMVPEPGMSGASQEPGQGRR
jgi:hypothetical protein